MRVFNIFLTYTISMITLISCELQFVLKFITNGAKSPIVINDINRDLFTEEWTYGTGVLTPVGYRMLYLLGAKDRETYKKFISESYNSNEIFIRAAALNTTLMSANAYLQGLYPPSSGPKLYPAQRNNAYPAVLKNFGGFDQNVFGPPALPRYSQVFPISTFDNIDKKYFFFKWDLCGPSQGKFEKYAKGDKVKTWLSNFVGKYGEQLTKILNINDQKEFEKYELVYQICTTFIADYTEGKILKKFTDNGIDLKEFNTTSHELIALDLYEVKNGDVKNGFMANSTISAFRDEALTWMDNHIKKNNTNVGYPEYNIPRFVLFSVSDLTVASIVSYFARSQGTPYREVPFGSSLSFELRTVGAESSEFVVDLVYNGEVLKTFAYADFKASLNASWNDEKVRKECANNLAEKYGYKNSSIVLGVLLGVTFLIFLITLYCCCKNRKSDQVEEDNRPEQVYQQPNNNEAEVKDA